MRTDIPDEDGLAGGGPALFRLVRFWSRRWAAAAAREATLGPSGEVASDAAREPAGRAARESGVSGPRRPASDAAREGAAAAAPDGAGDAAPVGHVLVLEAIDAASPDGGPAAIGDVAIELGLDRSNASRMLASAVAAGLVAKAVDPADARRTELAITPDGRALLAAARAWQQETFARLVAGWPEADAVRLAGYLRRLAAQTRQSTDRGGPS